MTTKALEKAWTKLVYDAGYDDDISCSPNMSRLGPYYANVDRLAQEREAELRPLIAAAKAAEAGRSHYAEGIEAALERAIATPRQWPIHA